DIHSADPGAEMRRDRPADGKFIEHVGHDRIAVPVAADAVDRQPADGQAAGAVPAIAVLLLKAPWAPLIADPHAGVEAAVKACGGREAAEDRVGLVRQAGPPAFSADIKLRPGARYE